MLWLASCIDVKQKLQHVGSRAVKAWTEKGPQPSSAMKFFGLWFLPLVVALKRRTEALPEGRVPSRNPMESRNCLNKQKVQQVFILSHRWFEYFLTMAWDTNITNSSQTSLFPVGQVARLTGPTQAVHLKIHNSGFTQKMLLDTWKQPCSQVCFCVETLDEIHFVHLYIDIFVHITVPLGYSTFVQQMLDTLGDIQILQINHIYIYLTCNVNNQLQLS